MPNTMSYRSIGRPSSYARSERNAMIQNLDGGVYYTDNADRIADAQSPEMVNLWYHDNMLQTRVGQVEKYTDDPRIREPLHSVTQRPFYGAVIMHVGGNLIKWTGSEPIGLGDVPDKPSLMFEMNATLYLLCDHRIFMVTKDLLMEETEPYIPTLFKDCAVNLYSKTPTEEQINLLTPMLRVTYSLSGGFEDRLALPYPADTAKKVVVKQDGKIINPDYYRVEQSAIQMLDPDTHFFSTFEPNGIEVIYHTTEEKFNKDMIFGCRYAEGFGGSMVSGTRMFVSGNPKYPGYYFRSELLNPLYFKELDFDVIGNGAVDITGFRKQYGDLIVFTKRSVGRLIYNYNENGPEFTVREINPNIGCDIPGSIQVIDNRIVFANYSDGLFIIDTVENTDERNIKPISANINGKAGVNGFFHHSFNRRKNQVSVDFDRKYWLCLGDSVLVWDYGKCPYYDTGNSTTAQNRLVWYYFNNIPAAAFFIFNNKKLYYLSADSEKGIVELSGDTDFGKTIQCRFRSKNYDLGLPHSRKLLKQIKFASVCTVGGHLKLEVDAGERPIFLGLLDNERFMEPYADFTAQRAPAQFAVKIKPFRCYQFSFSVENTSGTFSLSDVQFVFDVMT